MATVTIKFNQLSLPEKLAKKLRGKKLEIRETKDGILLKPAENAIKAARGFLKGGKFSSKRYMQLKKEEKELER